MKRIAPLTAAALLALTGTALAVPVNVLNQVTPLVCGGATPNEQVQVRLSNNCDASVPTAVIYRRVMGPDIVHSLMAPRGVVYDQHTVPAGQNIVRAIVRVDSSVAQCFAATLVGDLCI